MKILVVLGYKNIIFFTWMLPAVAKSRGQLRHAAHFAHWLAMAYTLTAHWLFEAFLIHIANCTTKYAPTSRYNQSFRDPLEDVDHGHRNVHALAATACGSSHKEVYQENRLHLGHPRSHLHGRRRFSNKITSWILR